MTDITSHISNSKDPQNSKSGDTKITEVSCNGLGFSTELVDFAELLFFAYRDFTSDPDAILSEFGFGRAHHRVLHFVYRYPGLRVADLLEILNITKQSLARVLKQLVDEGFITQKAGESDRRVRLLFVTAKGQELAGQLMKPQIARIAEAFGSQDEQTQNTVRQFLYNMITDGEGGSVAEVLSLPHKSGAKRRNK